MSVLVFAESNNGRFKKSAFEVVTFGYSVAKALGTECVAFTTAPAEAAAELGRFGAARVYRVASPSLAQFDNSVFASVISSVADRTRSDMVVLLHSARGKSLAGRLAIRLNAGVFTGINSLDSLDDAIQIRRPVFSGKATMTGRITSSRTVVTLLGNAVKPEEVGDPVVVEELDIDVPSPRIRVLDTKEAAGSVPLPEADRVISAGRGMKGPENWDIIEELARELGAATACSRPVADSGWRPHHEHVGQTGLTIRPNLYIAIGISGAIQHLAGVNNSNTIVVINKDPEAPFFKSADYGVCADLFDVVPSLIKAIQEHKQS